MGGITIGNTNTNLCVYEYEVGTFGNLNLQAITFNATLKACARGICEDAILSTTSKQAILGTYGLVYWIGSLVTGYQPPAASNYKAFLSFNPSETKAKIFPAYYYTQEQSKYEGIRGGLVGTALSSSYQFTLSGLKSSDQTVFNQNLQLITSMIAEMQIVVENIESGWTTQNLLANVTDPITQEKIKAKTIPFTVTDKMHVVGITESQLLNPTLVFEIKAAWIGILKPIGMPEITSPSCNVDFSSGEKGTLSLAVKNVGEGSDAFNIEMNDCEIFTQFISPPPIVLSPQASGVLTTTIYSPISNMDYTSSCPVKVISGNDPSKYDSIECNLNLSKAKQCQPYETRWTTVSGKLCIEDCSTDGKTWKQSQCCVSGQTVGVGTDGFYCMDYTERINGSGGEDKLICPDGTVVAKASDCQLIAAAGWAIPWNIVIIVIIVIFVVAIAGAIFIRIRGSGEK